MKKKKILIISYSFPPDSRSGVYRVIHFANHLLQNGKYSPYILTVDEKYYEAGIDIDYSLLRKVANGVSVYRTKCWQFRDVITHSIRKKSQKTIMDRSTTDIKRKTRFKIWQAIKDIITDGVLSFPDRQIGWLPFALFNGYKIIKDEQIKLILATASPWTSLLVGKILSLLCRATLVLDYRDPWLENPFNKFEERRLYFYLSKLLEKFIVNSASAVILNTEKLKDIFIEKYNSPNRFFVLYNGYDNADIIVESNENLNRCNKDEFIFIHAGSLYGNRSIDAFLIAFKDCLDRRIFGEIIARVILLGGDKNLYNKCLNILGESYFKKHCNVMRRIAHDHCVSYMKKSDCLLLFQQGTNVQVPRKLFEYLALQKPIIALTPDEGETSELIKKNDAGLIIKEDVNAIVGAMESMFMDYDMFYNKVRKNQYFKHYDSVNIVKKLESILDEF
ncbi:MAG: glycosyltransferase [Bacteroidales bacterium]|nr:glycosyltransferase [Bacteroidales bacterium]